MPLTRDELRRRVEALEQISFPSGTEDAERTIPAAWIRELFPEPGRVATHPIRISGAIIDGALILPYARAPYEIEILGCELTGDVYLGAATIERVVNFSGSHFHRPLALRFAQINHDIILRGCVFEDTVDFRDVTIRRAFSASAARFRGPFSMERADAGAITMSVYRLGDHPVPARFEQPARFHDLHAKIIDAQGVQFASYAGFERLTVDGVAFFRAAMEDDDLQPIDIIPTRFGGETSFRSAKFGREVDFSGAHFQGPAKFEAARVEGRFIIEARPADPLPHPTRFDGPANFNSMIIDETLAAGGCLFGAECDMGRMKAGVASFYYVHGDLCVAAVFRRDVSFHDAEVAGGADFTGVAFLGRAWFDRASVRGTLTLTHVFGIPEPRRTMFLQEASFARLRVGGDFICEGAEFRSAVNGSFMNVAGIVRFVDQHDDDRCRATIAGPVWLEGAHAGDLVADGIRFAPQSTFREITTGRAAYLEGAQFDGDADFRAANIAGKLTLDGARVAGDLLLRDAHAAVFAAEQLTSAAKVDARGFTFGRIDGDVRALLRRQEPYDLRLYEQAERFVRESGNEDLAGEMYIDRRRRETRSYWGAVIRPGGTKFMRWLMSLLLALYGFAQDLLFRYGVRPIRLLFLSIGVVLLGVWVFSQEGAVRPRDANAQPRRLTRSEALGYSMRTFMPVGDLPSGSQMLPTDNTLPRSTLTYEGYATIQRLLGLILVPLGIAAVTGLLMRKR